MQVPTITGKQVITLVAMLLHVTVDTGQLLLLLLLATVPITLLLPLTTLLMALVSTSLDLEPRMRDAIFAHIASPIPRLRFL